MKIFAKIVKHSFIVSVFCAVTSYGVTLDKALAADFSPVTTAEQYGQVTSIAEKATGIRLSSVLVWTPTNAADYQRFWTAFAYSHEYFVTSENWLPPIFDNGGGGGEGEGNE